MLHPSLKRYSFAAAWLVLTLNAAAAESVHHNPNAGMRYAAISTQGDNANNLQFTGMLGLTVGDHAWLQMGAGTLHTRQGDNTIDPILVSIGGGVAGQQLSGSLDFSQRKDDNRYTQRDWNGTLDWHNDTVGVGLDGMHRNTDVTGTVPMTTIQGTTDVSVVQSLNGNGIGLHARYNVTGRLTVSAGGMHYSYDVQTRQGAVAVANGGNSSLLDPAVNNILDNQPLLSRQLLTQTSGITRQAAILQRSWNAGISYRLGRTALSGQYFNDKALDGVGAIYTAELSVLFFLDKPWRMLVTAGHTSDDQYGATTFGALTVRFGW